MSAEHASGLFITLEGGDGSGKSTQAELLSGWLHERGLTVLRTREPGGTDVGNEVREIVLHHRGDIAPRAEALLYAADRAHHVATVVRPALDRGEVVLQVTRSTFHVGDQRVDRAFAHELPEDRRV